MLPVVPPPRSGSPAPLDRFGRPLRDLRLSVTDRCNFRCRYCMPREVFGPDHPFLPRAEILSFEEIARVVGALLPLGVAKVRLTGGEPLLRRDLPELVAQLRRAAPRLDLALTTNGALLERHADALAAAGLDRVTVSLDSLDPETFARMNDTRVPVGRVLAGIDAAAAAGLRPIKINCVVRRGMNDRVVELARRFHGTGHVVRFIEYMDVGTANGWRLDDVVPAAEILERLAAELPLEPLAPRYPGEVARRYRYRDGGGEVGVIASVTRPFCGDCTRARLSADGRLYTCLFASDGTDLRGPLRAGASAGELAELVARVWHRRSDRYSEVRSEATRRAPRVEMSYIGG